MASVNKPTDIKQKEADVNRKLQFYGILSAFQSGKVPSNDQIDVALNSFLATRGFAKPSEKLSPEGRALVTDLTSVVTQAKNLLLSKNEGNLLQDFIWQTQQFDPKAVNVPGAPVDKDSRKQHSDKALQGLRTLGTLIITNGQFRKLLNDATVLIRDMAGDAATNAATTIRPPEEKLSQIDRPADDNTWHEAPDFSKQNLKTQFQGAYKGGDPKADAQAIAESATSAAHPTGNSDPNSLATTAARDQQQGTSSGVDARSGVDAAKQNAKQTIEQRTDISVEEQKAQAKNKAKEYRAKTREYLSKKMPQDRRDQTIWRLKKMVIECQQHPDYEQAITTLLDLAEEYGGHATNLAQGGTGTVQETRSHLAQAEADLKTLIERFANGTSTDDLWAAINQIYKDADADPELKDWFKAIDKYVRRSLLEHGYILEDASTQDWDRLYDHGNYLLRQKYRTHTDRILDEFKFIGKQFDEDAQNKQFAQSLTKLFNDLGNDENGKPTFKPHLVKDLTEVILPATFESIAYIPVPRIEFSDPTMDVVIENLVLESDNFMPNLLEIHSENHLRFGRKKYTNKNQHAFEISVSGVQMDLRDVSYYIKRKQGFPSITDTGSANIFLGGEGFSFKLKISTADAKDSQNFFKVDKVDVDIKNMKIQLTKSKYKLLFGLVKPIMLKAMRPAIQKAAEKAIKDNFNKADALLRQVQIEANRAAEEVKDDPQSAPNIYSRYVNAAQKQFLQGRQKVDSATADKKVNYAMTQEDSIFPQVKLPGGISTKATEFKELARKGEKWESPVFSIGAAGKSSNIPAAPTVTQKSHATNGNVGTGIGTNGNSLSGTGLNGNTGNFKNPAAVGSGTTQQTYA